MIFWSWMKQKPVIFLIWTDFWKQKSHFRWFKDGDCNSKFFHQATKIKRNTLRIYRIKNSDNEWVEDPKEIAELDISNIFSRMSWHMMKPTGNLLIMNWEASFLLSYLLKTMKDSNVFQKQRKEIKQSLTFLLIVQPVHTDSLGIFFNQPGQ